MSLKELFDSTYTRTLQDESYLEAQENKKISDAAEGTAFLQAALDRLLPYLNDQCGGAVAFTVEDDMVASPKATVICSSATGQTSFEATFRRTADYQFAHLEITPEGGRAIIWEDGREQVCSQEDHDRRVAITATDLDIEETAKDVVRAVAHNLASAENDRRRASVVQGMGLN